MRWLFSWIGASLMWIGVKLVTAAGGIFEASLNYLLVGLGTYMNLLKPAIDSGWGTLRDIANIIIIGLFVFIAVNIILGVEEFGDKKKVARVLIVAVLINFSLLFTKIIVDASNFTAYQFYNSMLKGLGATPKNSTAVGSGEYEASISSSGIAATFITFLGIEGIADSADKLNKVAENNKNAFYALGYGLISFIFLVGTAMVFLYGAFLIVSRAILIAFLMLTSALAFASWLVPQHYIEKGFSKWWESLLKTAFFAPIFMALLWVVIVVSDGATAALSKITGSTAKGTLGMLAEDASGQGNILAVLNFAFVLGLLYAAFVASNAFSSTISGLNFTKRLAGLVTTTPLFGATSRLGGALGRTVLGGGSNWAMRRMQSAGLASAPGIRGTLGRAAMRPFNWAAKQSFEPLQNQAVRKAYENYGGLMLGDKDIGKGGFRRKKEEQAEELYKLAKTLAAAPKDRERLAHEAGRDAGDSARVAEAQKIQQERLVLAQEKQASDESKTRAEEELKRKKAAIAEEHGKSDAPVLERAKTEKQDAEGTRQTVQAARDNLIKAIAAETDETKREDMRQDLKKHDENIEAQDIRIKQANAVIGPLEAKLTESIQAAEEEARPALEAAQKVAEKVDSFEARASQRLIDSYQGAYKEAKRNRDSELQQSTLEETMIRNKLTLGKGEILRQLVEPREATALKKAAIAFGGGHGEAKHEEKKPAPAPKSSASPPPASSPRSSPPPASPPAAAH